MKPKRVNAPMVRKENWIFNKSFTTPPSMGPKLRPPYREILKRPMMNPSLFFGVIMPT